MIICVRKGAFPYVGCFLTWADSLESCWTPVDLPLILTFQRKSPSEFICKVSYEDLGFASNFFSKLLFQQIFPNLTELF